MARVLVRDRILAALRERGWLDGGEIMTDEIYSLLPDIPERSIRGALADLENIGVMEGCSVKGESHHRRFWKAVV